VLPGKLGSIVGMSLGSEGMRVGLVGDCGSFGDVVGCAEGKMC
jgi:hypothetical protein